MDTKLHDIVRMTRRTLDAYSRNLGPICLPSLYTAYIALTLRSHLFIKVIWRTNRSSGENYYVFSGGLPSDVTGVTPSITVMQGKSTTLLEMEYSVIDFLLLSDSPYNADYQVKWVKSLK